MGVAFCEQTNKIQKEKNKKKTKGLGFGNLSKHQFKALTLNTKI